jgi:hypothetical protein
MSERLPYRYSFTIDRHTNKPITGPTEIGYCRMLKLSVAIRTNHQQVIGVMADPWIEMVYLKVWFAVSFFESEGANLTPAIMQLSKQDADARGYALVALGSIEKYAWTRLPC